ncbi:MAG TPA: MFS transporter [Clostridia bacterium]|nr:MFS transporter [Clostridia bacterium]
MKKDIEVYEHLRHNIKMNMINGIAWVIGFNMVSPFIGIYAIKLGANDFQVSLLNSLSALMVVISVIPVTYLINRLRDVHRFSYIVLYIARTFYFLLALAPFFGKKLQPWVVVVLVGLMNLPSVTVGMCWQSFMSDLIPPEYRSKVFADRNFWTTIVGTAVVLITGWLLDIIKFPLNYQIIFTVAFIFGLIEAYYFSRFHVIVKEQKEVSNFSQVFKNMFETKKFIYFNATSFLFYFAWMMAWPIFTIYKVNYLHANNAWMSIFTIVSSIGSILAFYRWADLSNKKGNGYAVALSALFIGFIPLMWAMAKNLYIGAVFDFLGGIAVGGYNMLLLNWLLELLPPTSEKMSYLGVFTLITQIAAFISPMVGMWLYTKMGYVPFMVLTGILRILVSLLYFVVASYEEKIEEAELKG